ncbi:MAG TPA: peptidylprolyl isomerase [Actinomycetales bacterium]|nr:peptidylprolyl isomerase [Actinomycetales bacterium]
MPSSKREREYARKRYAKWQERQEERLQHQRVVRQRWITAGTVVAVIALIGGIFFFVSKNKGDDATQASPDPTASASASPSASASGNNPCPSPTVKPPAQPKQFEKAPDSKLAEDRTWTATIATSCGDIQMELYGDKAPQSVASFAYLAKQNFFVGTPCHRLTTQGIYVLQCGDPTGTGTGGPGYSWGPVENAPADDNYPAGTLAMARQGNKADSQGSQFFIVYKDSTIPSDTAGGYSVFGKVTKGLEIVQQIAEGGLAADGVAPARAISIEGVTVK